MSATAVDVLGMPSKNTLSKVRYLPTPGSLANDIASPVKVAKGGTIDVTSANLMANVYSRAEGYIYPLSTTIGFLPPT